METLHHSVYRALTRLAVYYCYSCSSLRSGRRLHEEPGDRQTQHEQRHCDLFLIEHTCCHGLRVMCVTLLRGPVRGLGGRSLRRVASVFFCCMNKETGWSSRLGTERRWRSRRAVYNNNTIRGGVTRLAAAAANQRAASPSATCYIWKVVTSSR